MRSTTQLSEILRLVTLVALLLAQGCATPQKDNWGKEARLTPGWEKFTKAMINAARDPVTWIPATAAIVTLASGRDEEWTQRAISKNWLYGSKENANSKSDKHAVVTDRIWLATMLFADSDESPWGMDKLQGVAAESLITSTSIISTNMLKKAIRRREPDLTLEHVEYEAFPSNHSTPQFTQAALIRRNLRYLPANNAAKVTLLTGTYLAASSSAYGRIEGGLHHFSDQLAGVALGNFIGLALYDTFVEEEASWLINVAPTMQGKGYLLQFSMAY